MKYKDTIKATLLAQDLQTEYVSLQDFLESSEKARANFWGIDLGSPDGDCIVRCHRTKDGVIVIDEITSGNPQPQNHPKQRSEPAS